MSPFLSLNKLVLVLQQVDMLDRIVFGGSCDRTTLSPHPLPGGFRDLLAGKSPRLVGLGDAVQVCIRFLSLKEVFNGPEG